MKTKPKVSYNHNCFTEKFNGIVSEIETDIHVGAGLLDPEDLPNDLLENREAHGLVGTKAIWDTGATATAISAELADKLGLIPIGFEYMTGINGTEQCMTYMVSFVLPNNMVAASWKVAAVKEIGQPGQDVLIGMDVMRFGDIAISNYDDKTTFSFRMPSSSRVIDFVRIDNPESAPGGMSRAGRREHKRKMGKRRRR